MKFNAVSKTCKVLETLYEGNTVEIDGYTYCMNKDNNVGIELYDENGKSNGQMLSISYSLNSFIKICDILSDEDILSICANKTLNKQLK